MTHMWRVGPLTAIEKKKIKEKINRNTDTCKSFDKRHMIDVAGERVKSGMMRRIAMEVDVVWKWR